MISRRIPKFSSSSVVKASGAASIIGNQVISMDELRHKVPSIFARSKHDSRSEQYSHISTGDVLERLQREGYQPFSAMQGGSRIAGKSAFTKHLIRLRHVSRMNEVAGSNSEIILMNSHDGTCSYRLMAGMFRTVCHNGTIVADSVLEDIRLAHKGDLSDLVMEASGSMLEGLPRMEETVKEMASIPMSHRQRLDLAAEAAELRFSGRKDVRISPIALVQPFRAEEDANTLWGTLNILQERLIRGKTIYKLIDEKNGVQRERTQVLRPINNIDQAVDINRKLWSLAEAVRASSISG